MWMRVNELEYLRTLQDYPGVLALYRGCYVMGERWDVSCDSETQQPVARTRSASREFWVVEPAR